MRKRKSTSVKKRVLSGLTAFLVAAANLNCGIGSSSFVQQVVADETQAQTSEEEFESEVEITEAEPVTEEAPKRKPGRPKKTAEAPAKAEEAPKKKPGRPKKIAEPAAKAEDAPKKTTRKRKKAE